MVSPPAHSGGGTCCEGFQMDLKALCRRISRVLRSPDTENIVQATLALFFFIAIVGERPQVPAADAAAATTLAPAEATTSLAGALRVIQSKKFVDLTHSFGPTSPVWGGFGQAAMSAAADPTTHQPY